MKPEDYTEVKDGIRHWMRTWPRLLYLNGNVALFGGTTGYVIASPNNEGDVWWLVPNHHHDYETKLQPRGPYTKAAALAIGRILS